VDIPTTSMDSANRSSKLHLVEATTAEVAGRDLDPHSKIKQALELNGCSIRAKHPFQLLSRRICSGGAGEGALPICSYSAITWAPNISKVDASSKLSKTTMAVVSDP